MPCTPEPPPHISLQVKMQRPDRCEHVRDLGTSGMQASRRLRRTNGMISSPRSIRRDLERPSSDPVDIPNGDPAGSRATIAKKLKKLELPPRLHASRPCNKRAEILLNEGTALFQGSSTSSNPNSTVLIQKMFFKFQIEKY